MASAYSAIANGGVLRTPHIIAAVDGRGTGEPAGRRIISAATATSLRQMLEGVLAPGGTASEVSIPGYQLAGKTGTANKPDPTTGGYSDTKFVSSFVGFAPARKPRLLVAIMVDEPHGEVFGGQVAAGPRRAGGRRRLRALDHGPGRRALLRGPERRAVGRGRDRHQRQDHDDVHGAGDARGVRPGVRSDRHDQGRRRRDRAPG